MQLLTFLCIFAESGSNERLSLRPGVLSSALLIKLDENLYCGPENAVNFM
jgi:hypothetical protein